MFGSKQRLEELTAFKAWMESHGLRVAPSRIGKYIKRFREFAQIANTEELTYELYDEFVFLLREVDELLWIYSGLRVAEPPGVLQVLERALGGTDLSRGDAKGSAARNFQYELRIASYFLQAGFHTDLSTDTDLEVTLPSGRFFVECKRISSAKQVMNRAKESRAQLRRRLASHRSRERKFAVAAFDISQVLHPEQGVSSGFTSYRIREGLRQQLIDFDDEYRLGQLFAADKDVLLIWLQITVPTVHARGPAARFSSLFLPLVPKTGPRAKAFGELRQALEVASPDPGPNIGLQETGGRPSEHSAGDGEAAGS